MSCKARVDFQIPGSPESKIILPGVIHPHKRLFNSWEVVGIFSSLFEEIFEIFEKYGYSIYYFNGMFVLYNISISKRDNKITLRVYTESKECVDFIESIKTIVVKD